MDLIRDPAEASGQLSVVVGDYYRYIDQRDIAAALACFSEDAVYRRPGYRVLVGLPAINEFYRAERVISAGRHYLESIVEDADTVAARGSFSGTSHDGDPLEVRFADFWRFSSRVVVERNTYFDVAAV
ncbi:nuclear transport factor 2 family protein [Streptomyces sp. NPDC045470]|uniref:nuclear transport factor 2 family protein n=1 Tax=Streptomyces sp. NPDC045470 TaxID=3155469 RepID=UPI00340DCE56